MVLAERLSAIGAPGAPARRLVFTRSSVVLGEFRPPAGWSLLDFAAHPSGHVSAALATNNAIELVRLDPAGTAVRRQAFFDPQARLDPRIDEGGAFDRDSMLAVLTRDAARVAPFGEDLVVAIRTGLNAVVAYRLRWTAGGLDQQWRTLVEPGMSLLGRFLMSGSHDVYGELTSHVRVHVETDDTGKIFVGVSGGAASNLFSAHAEHFQEGPIGAVHGSIVTQLSRSGQRIKATVIDTLSVSELHALRAVPAGVAAVGRVRTALRPDGTGWDGYAAVVTGSGNLQHYAVVNADRGDVLMDIAALPQGGYVAVGATGYTQNPTGASISETSSPLLVSLSPSGEMHATHPFPAGPRQNQLRSVAVTGTHWLIGGLTNGPGTHSGDSDPALIPSDGFVRGILPGR